MPTLMSAMAQPSFTGITAHPSMARAKAIPGEQSNTSIVFDGRFIGKFFRRVQPGLNPDLEIGEFLTRDARFAQAPKLFGLVDAVVQGDTYAIAAMQ